MASAIRWVGVGLLLVFGLAPPAAKSQGAVPEKILLTLDVTKNWQDGSRGAGQVIWKSLPSEAPRGTGVRVDFPALKPDQWFNFFLPLEEGTWPARGQKLRFWVRAAPAGNVRVRLNEMPGAAQGRHDRHDEFEGHAATVAAGPQWREVHVALSEFRLLWRHAGGNGQLELANVTGFGLEPADPHQPLRVEIAGVHVLQGEVGAGPVVSSRLRYRIAFNSDRDGNYEIFSMDSDGRNLDRLTQDKGFDLWPAPSPDGKRIAWMTNRDGNYEIYVMNADGSQPVNLTNSPKSQEGHPTWAPDSKTIAFTSDRDGDMELYVMDADGSNWKRLTNAKGSDGLPTFSPDGKQIIFVSERDGDHELYRLNVDGAGLTRLTNRKGLDTMPAWSPDGKTVAFVSDRDGDQAIFLMDPDGKNVRRLSGVKAFEGWPDWSPDGHYLCYHADMHGHFTICVVEVATGRVERLTRGRGSNRNPRFLPLTEEAPALPSVPPGGIRLIAAVSGYTTSGMGPNPQKYPFSYRGAGVLTREQLARLAKEDKVSPPLAQALGQALLWPGAADTLEAIGLRVAGKKISGDATVLHKYGKHGTHRITVRLEGTLEGDKIALNASKPTIVGSWNWGGGVAKLHGEVQIKLAIEGAGTHSAHDPVLKGKEPVPPPPDKANPPEKQETKGGVRLTAKVDGYTMATMFNPQKYPFRYTGSAQVNADHLAALGKAGAVPAETAKAILACLLWPKEGDSLDKAVLKSDSKKLTGEAQVLHKYGKQGTHTLLVKLEGTFEDGRLALRATEVAVSGTWNYGGGSVKLTGKAQVQFETGK